MSLFYFTSYVLNMFRTLIYPSSGACDCVVELPHRSSCSLFVVCWRFGAVGFWVVFVLQTELCFSGIIIIQYYNTYHCVTIAYSIQYSNMLYRFVA